MLPLGPLRSGWWGPVFSKGHTLQETQARRTLEDRWV